MASPAVPVSLLGKLTAGRKQAGLRVSDRARAWAARLAASAKEHLATFAGLAAISLGCFEAARPAGWIAVGVSVLLAEWKIRD